MFVIDLLYTCPTIRALIAYTKRLRIQAANRQKHYVVFRILKIGLKADLRAPITRKALKKNYLRLFFLAEILAFALGFALAIFFLGRILPAIRLGTEISSPSRHRCSSL